MRQVKVRPSAGVPAAHGNEGRMRHEPKRKAHTCERTQIEQYEAPANGNEQRKSQQADDADGLLNDTHAYRLSLAREGVRYPRP
jgi:hypothetical protein